MPNKKKVYLVIFTDRWQVDYITQEVWFSKAAADDRAKELTKKQKNSNDYFYIVEEKIIKDS